MGLRAATFVAVLNAAGIALFGAVFAGALDGAARPILRMGQFSAAAGIVALIAHRGFEPARLAGELDGLVDASLHVLLWSSDAGTTAAVQMLGLVIVLWGFGRPGVSRCTAGAVGAALTASSFAFMGHTAAHELRWLLGPMLIVHVVIVAFWFGALWPLHLVSRHESLPVAAAVVERFSAIAARLVPMILIAGLGLSIVLVPNLGALLAPYGALLLTKVGGFALLMVLAALNKMRYGPAMMGGNPSAAAALGVSVRLEWAVIAAVLIVAAVMTSLFSPMPAEH